MLTRKITLHFPAIEWDMVEGLYHLLRDGDFFSESKYLVSANIQGRFVDGQKQFDVELVMEFPAEYEAEQYANRFLSHDLQELAERARRNGKREKPENEENP